MNADDRAPRNSEETGAPPGLPQATAGREHAGRTEAGTGAALPADEIMAGDRAAGTPQQEIREKRPHEGFWGLLSPAEQAALQASGQVSVFHPGTIICAEGEKTTQVIMPTEGWVKVLLATKKDRTMTLALRGHGDIVGEMAGDCTGYRTATIAAIGLVRALIVTHDRFTLFLDSNPGASRAYRHVTAQRLHEATNMLRNWSVNNGAQRLAGLLLDLADRHGTSTGPGTVITIPLSQDDLASLIGASRATVTRALADWRRSGLIGTARHQITITNAPGLRRVADRETAPLMPARKPNGTLRDNAVRE